MTKKSFQFFRRLNNGVWPITFPSFSGSSISKNQKKSFKPGNFYAKILLFRTNHLQNSTTELILIYICYLNVSTSSTDVQMFLKVSTSLTNCIPQCRLAQRISILSPPHSRPTPNYNSQRNLTWQIDLWPWIWNSVNTLHNRSLKTCFILSDISPRTIVTKLICSTYLHKSYHV